MNAFKVKGNRKTGPEAKIQEDIIKALRAAEWIVVVTHGNIYQHGLPDLYCAHKLHGSRWLEVKNTKGSYSFTPAQLELFPLLSSKGVGIWVLGSAEPSELQLLLGPANWWAYLSVSKL